MEIIDWMRNMQLLVRLLKSIRCQYPECIEPADCFVRHDDGTEAHTDLIAFCPDHAHDGMRKHLGYDESNEDDHYDELDSPLVPKPFDFEAVELEIMRMTARPCWDYLVDPSPESDEAADPNVCRIRILDVDQHVLVEHVCNHPEGTKRGD